MTCGQFVLLKGVMEMTWPSINNLCIKTPNLLINTNIDVEPVTNIPLHL